MKVIIAGTRTMIPSLKVITSAVEIFEETYQALVTEVVSGGAEGVDNAAIEWAQNDGMQFTVIPADWEQYGKQAGPIRNSQMANYAEGLIAIWDGSSRGTADMVKKAKAKGLHVLEIRIPKGGSQ